MHAVGRAQAADGPETTSLPRPRQTRHPSSQPPSAGALSQSFSRSADVAAAASSCVSTISQLTHTRVLSTRRQPSKRVRHVV